jgi:large subunit ribosomal protein L32
MSTPTQKHTKARSRRGRAHLALKKRKFTLCPQCKRPILPHHTCPYCGNYRGKKIINIKLPKKTKPEKEKK